MVAPTTKRETIAKKINTVRKREALNGKIKNRIGKKLNATIENKIVAFVYVLCSLLFLS